MLSRMVKMTIRELDQEIAAFPTAWKEDVIVEMDFPGFGLHFEADAVARSFKGECVWMNWCGLNTYPAMHSRRT